MKSIDLKIDEFTTPTPLTAKVDATVSELKNLMSAKGIRHLPISDGHQIVGIVSDRDLKTLDLAETDKIKAKDFMTTDIFTVAAKTPIEQVSLT